MPVYFLAVQQPSVIRLTPDNSDQLELVPTTAVGGGTSDDISNLSLVSGTNVTQALNALLANQPVGTALGQEWFFDGTTWQLFGVKGGQLTDADATVNYSQGPAFYWKGTFSANRTFTLGVAGPPSIGYVDRFYLRDSGARTVALVNGGTNGGTIYTKPAGVPQVIDARYNGVDWVLGGVQDLTS